MTPVYTIKAVHYDLDGLNNWVWQGRLLRDGATFVSCPTRFDCYQDALTEAERYRGIWASKPAPRILIRVDGEFDDAPLVGEETDAPSMTWWQRDVDEQGMRDAVD